MTRLVASLKKLIGRIKKMKLRRDLWLVLFILLASLLFNALMDIFSPLNYPDIIPYLKMPIVWVGFLCTIGGMVFIVINLQNIDKQASPSKKNNNELTKAIGTLNKQLQKLDKLDKIDKLSDKIDRLINVLEVSNERTKHKR